jgi:hypothetical protein
MTSHQALIGRLPPTEDTCTVVVTGDRQLCGQPAVTSFTGRDGVTRYHECALHAPRTGRGELTGQMSHRRHISAPRPMQPLSKLTPHQREVLNRLIRRAQRWPVDVRDFGSRGALDKLVDKGWATVEISYGPRGGEIRRYRPR